MSLDQYRHLGVLSVKPVVVLSCVDSFFPLYANLADVLAAQFRQPFSLVLQVWQSWEQAAAADPRSLEGFAAAVRQHTREHPGNEIWIACNTEPEVEIASGLGLNARFLHHNAFVNEHIFKPMPAVQKQFDAVYSAQMWDRKRHELAADIASICLVFGMHLGEHALARLAEVKRFMPQAFLANGDPLASGGSYRLLSQNEVNQVLNQSRVGLCLSAYEGGSFATVEYLLAGLPVVSTPSLGDRDVFFQDPWCFICGETPGEVRDAVAAMIARHPSGDVIRARTLEKVQEVRSLWEQFVGERAAHMGQIGTRNFAEEFPRIRASWAGMPYKSVRTLLDYLHAQGSDAQPAFGESPIQPRARALGMKTLIFCTSFASTQQIWQLRYRRWLDALPQSNLRFDEVLIVDDGSSVLPEWPDAAIVSAREASRPESVVQNKRLVLYHFEDHLGRKEIYDFPGWYRSFAFAAQYAEAHGFEKIVHVESDAYLISERIVQYVNALSKGWTVFWCQKYNFPEMAIQIVAGNEVASFATFFRQPYESLVGKNHELMLPYTRVVRRFVGDRYGESLENIPRSADYATQVQIYREAPYYWWLGRSSATGSPDLDRRIAVPPGTDRTADLFIDFGVHGNSERYVGSGWSYPEAEFRWMIGPESELFLPAIPSNQDYALIVWLVPCTHEKLLPRQRLRVELNGGLVAEAEIDSDRIHSFVLPKGILNDSAQNLVRFIHPDAASPVSLGQGNDDRRLAVALGKVILRKISEDQDRDGTGNSRVSDGNSTAHRDVQVGAHIQHRGDDWSSAGDCSGSRGSGAWIEGVMISPGSGIPEREIEYLALRSGRTATDWCSDGEFCGSRGLGSPLSGLRLRLRGATAEAYELCCSATFIDGSSVGPLRGDDITCQAESCASLEALKIMMVKRGSPEGDSSATAPSAARPIQMQHHNNPSLGRGKIMTATNRAVAIHGQVPGEPKDTRARLAGPNYFKTGPQLSLDQLGRQFGTDKSSVDHNYLGFYDRFFEPLRQDPVKLLEIGVFRGASLRMWEAYFPNATIIGADVDPTSRQFASERTTIEIIDQSNVQDLIDLGIKHGPFDIIIDDGSHQWEHQITSFRLLFAFVTGGGFYIIEDLQTNFGNLGKTYKGASSISCAAYLQRLQDYLVADAELDISSEEDAFLRTYRRSIELMVFRRHACLIEKIRRQPGDQGRAAVDRFIAAPLVPIDTQNPGLPITLTAHIGHFGDITNSHAAFVSIDNSYGASIQGFQLSLPDALRTGIECRARLANGVWTDWVNGGSFVGTRGKGEDLTGFSVRLDPALKPRYDLEAIGAFAVSSELIRVADGQDCAPQDLLPLRGMQIVLTPRG